MTGVRGRLDRFADFIFCPADEKGRFCLADEKGRVPSIGDDDEGRALSFVPAHGTYAFDIARRIKPPVTLPSIQVFRRGGYSVIRDFRWHVIFDHGPLGYLAIAAHGHADALSVCIALDSKPLLVDPGTSLSFGSCRT